MSGSQWTGERTHLEELCPPPPGRALGAVGQRGPGVCRPASGTLLAAVRTVLPLSEWTWRDGPLASAPGRGLRTPAQSRPRGLHGQPCDSTTVFKCLCRQPKNK